MLLPPLNPPLRDWRGRRAWIVGASSGIGAATAQALHTQGAQVWVSARNAARLQALSSACDGMHALPLDVTDVQAVEQTYLRLRQTAGSAPDLVLYCAGHYEAMDAADLDLDALRAHWNVNYVGALHLLAAVLPDMRRRGQGHLSLVSSVAGFRGLPRSLAYGPTKAALINLAENLYLDLHREGLGVSVVNPGFVKTPLTARNPFPMPGLIGAEAAAQAILQGWARGDFDIHFPKRFTRWMQLLRLMPDRPYFAAVARYTGLG